MAIKSTKIYPGLGTNTDGAANQAIVSSELGKKSLRNIGRVQVSPPAGNYSVTADQIGKHLQIRGVNTIGSVVLPDPGSVPLSSPFMLENNTNVAFRVVSTLPFTSEWGNLSPGAKMRFEVQSDGGPTDVNRWQIIGQDATAQKVNSATLVPAATNVPSSFLSFSEAQNPAVAGDTLLLSGYQSADLNPNKSLIYDFTGATMGINSLTLGTFKADTTAINMTAKRIGSAGVVNVVRQKVASNYFLPDIVLEGKGHINMYGLDTDDTSMTTATVTNPTVRRTIATPPTDLQTSTNGCVSWLGYNNYGNQMTLIVDGGVLISTIGPVFSGATHPNSRIILRDTERPLTLMPGAGFNVFELINLTDGSAMDASTIIVDQRTRQASLSSAPAALRTQIQGYDETHWTNNRLQGTQPLQTLPWLDTAGQWYYQFIDGILVRTATYA